MSHILQYCAQNSPMHFNTKNGIQPRAQEYFHAIVAARLEYCTRIENLRIFLNRHLGHDNPGPTANGVALTRIDVESLVETVEFFTELCVLLFSKSHRGLYKPPSITNQLLFGKPAAEKQKILETCFPLSMWDKQRIRRGLLHFQPDSRTRILLASLWVVGGRGS